MRRKVLAGITTIALTLGAATGAFAATRYPAEGGTWEYGNGWTSAWSYYTADRCHGSSIYRNGAKVSRSIDTAPGETSDAYTNHAPWTDGYHFYYRVC